MTSFQLSRRTFLATAAVGGGVALAFHWPFGEKDARANKEAPELNAPEINAPDINAWVVIRPDDTVVIRVARSEMGQGVFTSLPMLVAEELECDWTKVVAEYASPAENFRRNRVWGDMSTNASRSVAASQQVLLHAGAAAREMLIAAAASGWNVPPSECKAARGIIAHLPSGRTTTFGSVADTAAHIEPPEKVALKDPKDWKLIGTPQRRLDVRAKVEGKPIYGIDVRVPGMLYAAIVHCPVVRGTLRAVDSTKALRMKGVRHVVSLPDAVAVVADGWWQASQACEALEVTWHEGDNGRLSTAGIAEHLRDGLTAKDITMAHRTGDVAAGLQNATTRVEADYFVPMVAHATMEPQNCTAHVADGRVEVWAPT